MFSISKRSASIIADGILRTNLFQIRSEAFQENSFRDERNKSMMN